jgi:DNA modification methylase
MAGSGTTLVTARVRGHQAIGFDRDPLAVLIGKAWITNVDANSIRNLAKRVLARARLRAGRLTAREAFPKGADATTKKFLRYWFDRKNRIQLAALADCIARIPKRADRALLWCAMSRLIVTKKIGVSLAMDVSHSRPHKKYLRAPINTFDCFPRALEYIIKASPFSDESLKKNPQCRVRLADARRLPLDDNSVDVVITSPPYLNAIDYLRGHKLSLVWMGYSVEEIRNLRSTNVGTERSRLGDSCDKATELIVQRMYPMSAVSNRAIRMLQQYVSDMRRVFREIKRVLRRGGKAVVIIGNCNIRTTFVRNSDALELIAAEVGLILTQTRKRRLPKNKRYLPPPTASGTGKELNKRMREEVVLTFRKF